MNGLYWSLKCCGLPPQLKSNLINNPRMFNGAIFDLAEKPYIPQKNLLQ